MNQPATSQQRHIVPPTVTGLSEQDRIRANAEHDLKMGWCEKHGRIYTNPKRHPETFTGRLDEA